MCKNLKAVLAGVLCITSLGMSCTAWTANAEDITSSDIIIQTANNTPRPFEIKPDDGYFGGSLTAYTLSDYTDEAENWDADFLNQALGVTTIQSVDGTFINDSSNRRELFIKLTQDDRQTAFEIAQKLYNTGWFYDFAMTYAWDSVTEDTALPFNISPDEKFLSNTILTLVKANYSAEAENWTADYLNQLLDITNIKDVNTMFTDDFTGRRCLFISMKEYDREIAFETAQELYNTGLFYSVDMNASEELLANDEPLPFDISPDDGYVGGSVIAFTLLNYSEESKNWDADFLNQALDVNVIDYVDGDLMSDNEGRRGLIIYLNHNQDDKQTAFEIAQKLYNTGWFYDIEMNYLCGNDTAPNTEFTKGDVSGDADVNILDVISINKAVLGKETLSQEQNQAADLDGNGKVDANDALLLLKYIVGLAEI